MLATTEDSVIIQKTRELCQAILSQPEFGEIRRQVDDFLADDKAKELYQFLSEQGEYLQHKQQMGTPPTQQEISEYEQQRQAFLSNTKAQGFMQAQRQMHMVQEQVSQYVTKTFELGRVPGADDFEEGSCGHGCGCSH